MTAQHIPPGPPAGEVSVVRALAMARLALVSTHNVLATDRPDLPRAPDTGWTTNFLEEIAAIDAAIRMLTGGSADPDMVIAARPPRAPAGGAAASTARMRWDMVAGGAAMSMAEVAAAPGALLSKHAALCAIATHLGLAPSDESPARAVSATTLRNGDVVLDVGGDTLRLSAREARVAGAVLSRSDDHSPNRTDRGCE